ncbi:MAG: SurA N-terminal domain-containing protein [Luteolibacter sp.]
MKLSCLSACTLGAIIGLLTSDTSCAQARKVNGIAAKVNGRVITMNEVSFMLAPIYNQLRAQYPRRGEEFMAKLNEARDKVLQELIDREIILDEFKQLGASIPDRVVENQVKREINRLYGGDKAKFNEELRRSRLTMSGYRQMSKEKIIVQAMRQEQFDDAAPPLPNEIQNEYNSVKADMRDVTLDTISFHKIFIPTDDIRNPTDTPESQLALAEELVNDLKNGKDMAELAKIHSKDAFADQGGFQENVSRTDLSSEFAAIIFDAKAGDVIGPLSDKSGYTIVKPSKITLGPEPSLSEVRDIIEERVRRKKTSTQYEAWIEKRRKRAMIDIKL